MTKVTFNWDTDKESMSIKNMDKLSFTQISALRYCLNDALDLVLKDKLKNEHK